MLLLSLQVNSMIMASGSWIHCVLADADTLKKSLQPRNSELVSLEQNLVDIVWAREKPARPKSKVFPLDTKYSGESSEGKIRRLREELTKKKVKAMVVNMLDEVAWLFNLRGADIDFNPGPYLEPYISPRF
jgi:Xaa-Pro aminopeptidase